MPELPEVETIKNELGPLLVGRCIIVARVFNDIVVRRPDADTFRREIAGRRIEALGRRGKYLLISLSSPLSDACGKADDMSRANSPSGSSTPQLNRPLTLIVHLKLSGALLVNPDETQRFKRVQFDMDDGSVLLLSDPRGFGRVWLVEDIEPVVGKLGPEPFSRQFTIAKLKETFEKRKAPVKSVLLEQEKLAGVGNMYADEALFAAKIHPETRAEDLSETQIKRLYRAIKQVLSEGIARQGATTRDYLRPSGNIGHAQEAFMVAHRRGARCRVCDTPIQRIVVRNRGTYFCPKCQRM